MLPKRYPTTLLTLFHQVLIWIDLLGCSLMREMKAFSHITNILNKSYYFFKILLHIHLQATSVRVLLLFLEVIAWLPDRYAWGTFNQDSFGSYLYWKNIKNIKNSMDFHHTSCAERISFRLVCMKHASERLWSCLEPQFLGLKQRQVYLHALNVDHSIVRLLCCSCTYGCQTVPRYRCHIAFSLVQSHKDFSSTASDAFIVIWGKQSETLPLFWSALCCISDYYCVWTFPPLNVVMF